MDGRIISLADFYIILPNINRPAHVRTVIIFLESYLLCRLVGRLARKE